MARDISAAGPQPPFVDSSFTRPAGYIDPALRQRLRKQFDRLQPLPEPEPSPLPEPGPPRTLNLLQKTIIIGRQEGLLSLGKAILTYPQRLWLSRRRK
jgi:hypothetical protein